MPHVNVYMHVACFCKVMLCFRKYPNFSRGLISHVCGHTILSSRRSWCAGEVQGARWLHSRRVEHTKMSLKEPVRFWKIWVNYCQRSGRCAHELVWFWVFNYGTVALPAVGHSFVWDLQHCWSVLQGHSGEVLRCFAGHGWGGAALTFLWSCKRSWCYNDVHVKLQTHLMLGSQSRRLCINLFFGRWCCQRDKNWSTGFACVLGTGITMQRLQVTAGDRQIQVTTGLVDQALGWCHAVGTEANHCPKQRRTNQWFGVALCVPVGLHVKKWMYIYT